MTMDPSELVGCVGDENLKLAWFILLSSICQRLLQEFVRSDCHVCLQFAIHQW